MATTPKRRRPRTPPRRYPPEVLTDAEVRLLMDACGVGPRGDRNRAILSLMYRTGLRVSDALALSPKDVDLHAGTVRVLNGKGGKTRAAGIDPDGAAVVAAWSAVREEFGVGAFAPLFCALPRGVEAITGRVRQEHAQADRPPRRDRQARPRPGAAAHPRVQVTGRGGGHRDHFTATGARVD